MRRAMRTRLRKTVRTPGGITKWVVMKRRSSHAKCKCGAKLNRARLNPAQVGKLTKTEKRPTRPYPELCSKCMRAKIKSMVK